MKRYGVVLTIVILTVVFCVNAEAAPDKTVSVSAGVNITGTTSLSVSPASIMFGTYSADAFPTDPLDKKIVITYSSNYNPWKIAIYTNNTQVKKYADDPEEGRYAKGGLATASGSNIIPCKWISKVGTNTVVPTVPTKTSAHNYIIDKRDEDDPATVTNPDGTLAKEDWASAFAVGYANIAFGDATGGFCVDPTNTTPSDPKNKYKGDAVSGSIAVYIAGLFGTGGATSAGDYSSSIYFDLYHE